MSSVKEISFNGSLMGVGTNCGYGYAAVELINAWNRLGIPVWWGKDEAPIAFSFSQPEFYGWQTDEQYKIGYTPWESTKLPYGWKKYMNEMDEIWTPSQACKEWFIDGGISRKVRVLHHGINREHFPAKVRSLHGGDTFKFLHIGEPAERKGGEYVYETFVDAFGGSKKVSLTLKGSPRFKVDAPNVRVLRGWLSQEQLLQLYHSHHAFIYPSNGEGFGLLPFQAAATGMPTLATDWGGMKDFNSFTWPIHVERMEETKIPPHEGNWSIPDLNSMKLWMEYFVDSPEYFFHKAFNYAKKMDKNWTWDIVAKQAIDWMDEGLKKR